MRQKIKMESHKTQQWSNHSNNRIKSGGLLMIRKYEPDYNSAQRPSFPQDTFE